MSEIALDSELRKLFRELTGGLEAHDFQVDVARRLLAGESLVLVSPTGSGKSWAALLAFAYARRNGIPFADRLIYAFPQRTLTTALYQQYGECLEREWLRPTLQMGGMERGEGDAFFEGDVIFTTIDQLLSGYIGVPVSLPQRLANLPAGALVGSCVVFDEFHLLEPDKALATALDLAEWLGPYAQTLFMSATFSHRGVEEMRRRFNGGEREVSPEELSNPNGEGRDTKETQRKFIWSGKELTAKAVLEAHDGKSIVVCNTVDRATSLYRSLISLAAEHGVHDRILLLHARFLPEDRGTKEGELLSLFAEESSERAILVATQVVEVGLDISAGVLHTEVAPASAILQRAGRCARFGGEGLVYVHEIPRREGGKRDSAPYTGNQEPLVDSTARELEARSGEIFGFDEERDVLNAVHAEADLENLNSVNPRGRRREVIQSTREGSGAFVQRLVREVDAVNLIVHPGPGNLPVEAFPSISVSRSVVRKEFKKWGWEGRVSMLSASDESREESESYAPRSTWKLVEDVKDLGQTFYLCLPPELADYTPEEGLVLGRSGNYVFEPDVREKTYGRSSYRKEPWLDHIRRVMERYEEQEQAHRVGVAYLSRQLGSSEEAVERMGLLVAALHDLGKLAEDWQEKIWLWQQNVRPDEPRDCFLGHSDFDGTDPKHREHEKESKYKKPPHAVEGYYVGLRLLSRSLADWPEELCGNIIVALGSAIARHHSASASSLREFRLAPGYEAVVGELLERFELEVDLRDRPSAANREVLARDYIIDPEEHENVLPLYWYMVRRLRLADQKSHDW